MKQPTTLCLFALSVSLTGCASFKSRSTTLARPAAQMPILPRVQAYPVNGQVGSPEKQIVMGEPNSVWRPTVIAHVKVDGYVDENNVMWKPTEGYVVVQEGGWNLDAVRKGNTYVPPENSMKPMNLPGVAYGSATLARPPSATPAGAEALPLYDIDRGKVLYTNLIRQEDEAQARAMATEGNVAIFDPRIGWVIVPQATVKDAMEMTSRLPELPTARVAVPAATAPATQATATSQPTAKSKDL